MKKSYSVCRKLSESKCRSKKQCMFAKGSMRRFCRKTGAKSCKGKTVQECSKLSKCLFTKGNSKYCRRKTVKKR